MGMVFEQHSTHRPMNNSNPVNNGNDSNGIDSTSPRVVLWPLVKRETVVWLMVVGGIVVAWSGLAFWFQHLSAPWQTAQAQLQTAQAEWDQATADQFDFDTHRRSFEQLKASGLMDGEPRAAWAEEVQSIAVDSGLSAQLSFMLAPPTPVDMPQSQATPTPTRVTRHVMDIQLTGVHDTEALHFLIRLSERHQRVSRLSDCTFERRGSHVDMKCRVNFLHIDVKPTPAQNAGTSQ